MISLLAMIPLVLGAPITEQVTLTSGLVIEAQYLPDADAFLIDLESFAAITSDLELAGPSCTRRVSLLKRTCDERVNGAIERAEHRYEPLYAQWLVDQEQIERLTSQRDDARQSATVWSWVAGGVALLGASATTWALLR
jgi:hypothetical protein